MPRDLTGAGDVADELVAGDATDELGVAGVLDDLDEDEPHPASTIAAETANASPAAVIRGPSTNPLNHKPLSSPKRTPATRPIGTQARASASASAPRSHRLHERESEHRSATSSKRTTRSSGRIPANAQRLPVRQSRAATRSARTVRQSDSSEEAAATVRAIALVARWPRVELSSWRQTCPRVGPAFGSRQALRPPKRARRRRRVIHPDDPARSL